MQPKEKLPTWLLPVFSALLLFASFLACLSGIELYGLSASSESWTYVEDQIRGKRFACSHSRSLKCGLWLYLNIHEEPLFYERNRPNYTLLKQSTLRGKSVNVSYACPLMGQCEPGELIVEDLGTIVSFEQTEPDLQKAIILRFLLAAVTLALGVIFSTLAYRQNFYPVKTQSAFNDNQQSS